MEQQSAQPKKFILNYGLLVGIISVVLGVVLYVTNSHLTPHWGFAVLTYALFILFVVWGIKAFKSDNGGFLGLGEAIKVGIGIALVAGLISSLWTVLLSEVIEPDYSEQMAVVQRDAMIEQNLNMTQEQMDAAMEFMEPFQSPLITIPIFLVGYIFFGLIVSLIAGLVMRQKRPHEV